MQKGNSVIKNYIYNPEVRIIDDNSKHKLEKINVLKNKKQRYIVW